MGILSNIRNVFRRRNVNIKDEDDVKEEFSEPIIYKEDNDVNSSTVNVKNEIIDTKRMELLKKIDKDRFSKLCDIFLKEESYFSDFFLELLSNNMFIDKLCSEYISFGLLDKINNNSYDISSVDKYERWLFKYLPFTGKDKVIVDMINKDVSLDNNSYYMVSFNDINSIGTDKVLYDEKIASLFYGIEIILNRKEVVLLSSDIYDDSLIKVVNPIGNNNIVRDGSHNMFYDGEVRIDNNTIIVMKYNKFMELCNDKEFINKFSKCNIVFDEDFELLHNLSTKLPSVLDFNIGKSFDYFDNINILCNHLLYIIDNSNLCRDKKEYYKYSISQTYYLDDRFEMNYQLTELVRKLVNNIGIDYIKKITDDYNNLSFEVKNREIDKVEFNANMFINGIGDFNNMSAVSLLRVINSLSKEERQIVIKNERIRNKFRNDILLESKYDEWGYYRNLFNNNIISIKDFFSIIDGDYLKDFYSNNRDSYKYILFGAICEKDSNKLIEACLNDIELFKNFYEEMNHNSFDFRNISYDNVINIINLIGKIKGNDYSFVRGISVKWQYSLLKEEFNDDVLAGIVNNCTSEVIQFFVTNDKRIERIYSKLNIFGFQYKEIKFSEEFLHNHSKYIFDKLKDKSLVNYRSNIDKFNSNNASLELIDRFDKYEEDIINSFDVNTEIFSYYKDKLVSGDSLFGYKEFLGIEYDYMDNNYDLDNIEGRTLFLKKISIIKLSEVVVDKLFKDNIYNVHLNIGEMLRYNSFLSDDEKVLDNNSIKFYESILYINKKSGKDIINLYNKVKDKNIDSMFYDDITKLKNKSYDNIKHVLFNPSDSESKISKELSDKYGVSIYDFRDSEYTMLVRCLNSQYRDDNNNRRDCYTLLSNLNSKVLHSDSYIYGYSGFDNDCILHIFEGDAYSADSYDDIQKVNNSQVNRIMTPKQIITSDSNISEVQILNKKSNEKRKYSTLKPSFICVYDEVNDKVLEEARRLNIPIVIIRDNKLDYGLRGDITYDKNKDDYVFNDMDIEMRNMHR